MLPHFTMCTDRLRTAPPDPGYHLCNLASLLQMSAHSLFYFRIVSRLSEDLRTVLVCVRPPAFFGRSYRLASTLFHLHYVFHSSFLLLRLVPLLWITSPISRGPPSHLHSRTPSPLPFGRPRRPPVALVIILLCFPPPLPYSSSPVSPSLSMPDGLIPRCPRDVRSLGDVWPLHDISEHQYF